MDITKSVVAERDRALLGAGGDHHAYHAQTTRKVHHLRRRLGASNRGRKYVPKSPVTAENVGQNAEWVQLLLVSSERAWASAMTMKAAQSAENTQKPMPGSTRRQIASRLRRAIGLAENLVDLLQNRATTGATDVDDAEARAYLAMMQGTLSFEMARWQACIEHYAVTQVVYATLGRVSKTDVYKDLLSSIVDPSLRYAAYQVKMPRTKPVAELAVEQFPATETSLKEELLKLEPRAFELGTDASAAPTGTGPGPSLKDTPSTITWRRRTVKLEDANISQALGRSKEQVDGLAGAFQSFQQGALSAKDVATAYEEVITAYQDAADATKSALDELAGEGVDPGDGRMQSLQITRTAVNYAVIEWRIGRNRLLCGPEDGLAFDAVKHPQLSKGRKGRSAHARKDESAGRRIFRLRESVALYDSILRSIDSVQELPGVIADTSFVDELASKRAYFRALKCLAVGRSHALNDQVVNALALYVRALELAQGASSELSAQSNTEPASDAVHSQPPRLDVPSTQLIHTVSRLQNLVTQYRALAELKSLSAPSAAGKGQTAAQAPLIECLHRREFMDQVNLANLVLYPPRLRPVPVKPLFFDLAWNYIVYPGQQPPGSTPDSTVGQGELNGAQSARLADAKPDAEKPTKKGWFGFGR